MALKVQLPMLTYALQWGMQFNLGKCHVIHLGRNNPRNVYYKGGKQLATTNSEKDVGVTISDNFKPTEQCRRAAWSSADPACLPLP
jgi:hypothetical protein